MYLGIFIVTLAWLVLLAALTLLAGLLRNGATQAAAMRRTALRGSSAQRRPPRRW
jgi:hypothetical protein